MLLRLISAFIINIIVPEVVTVVEAVLMVIITVVVLVVAVIVVVVFVTVAVIISGIVAYTPVVAVIGVYAVHNWLSKLYLSLVTDIMLN